MNQEPGSTTAKSPVDRGPTAVPNETTLSTPSRSEVDMAEPLALIEEAPSDGHTPSNEEPEAQQEATDDRSEMLAQFNQYVQALEQIKAVTSSISGKQLLKALNDNKNQFLALQIDLDSFKTNCAEAVGTAQKTELAQHSTCMKLLSALAFWITAIATGGIAPVISYFATGNARFFKLPETQAATVLQRLSEDLQSTAVSSAG